MGRTANTASTATLVGRRGGDGAVIEEAALVRIVGRLPGAGLTGSALRHGRMAVTQAHGRGIVISAHFPNEGVTGPGAPPGLPPLPSIQGVEGFWGLAAGLSLLGAAFAAVYLVTYLSGFRGGDRAMVARPHFEGAAPAGVSGIPGTASGAEAS
jgi:hypothetical protein